MLNRVADNLWIAKAPLLPFSTIATMTIARVNSGDLVVISPIKVDEAMVADIKALGKVVAVLSPNAFHHLYFHKFLIHFPNAHYFYAPALTKKITRRVVAPEKAFPLSIDLKEPWALEVKPIHVGGMPFVDEFVFYHAASKTLIACDLFFFINKPHGLMARLFWKLAGLSPDSPGQSRFFRFMIKDTTSYKKALQTIYDLDIEKIIVAHEKTIDGQALVEIKNQLLKTLQHSAKKTCSSC